MDTAIEKTATHAYRLSISLIAAGTYYGAENGPGTPEDEQTLENELIKFVTTAYTPAEA